MVYWRVHDGREYLADFFLAAPPPRTRSTHKIFSKILKILSTKVSRFSIAYKSLNIRPIKVRKVELGSLGYSLKNYIELPTLKPLSIITSTRGVVLREKSPPSILYHHTHANEVRVSGVDVIQGLAITVRTSS